MQLLNPPEALMAVALDGDERLSEFVHQQRRYSVASHWGPERLESGWWRVQACAEIIIASKPATAPGGGSIAI